jgi:hypothetical protein
MTSITRIRSINVINGFPAGDNTVVATGAGSNDMTMVYGAGLNWYPWNWSRLMAGIARVSGINV